MTTATRTPGITLRHADGSPGRVLVVDDEASPTDLARLRAPVRRTALVAHASTSVLSVGDLTMDEDSHEVTRSGEQIALTATEFELLRYLMRNPRRVLSKAQILDRVWSYDFGGKASIVELYISYLRKKVDAGRTPMIQTMRGVGYVIKPAA